MKASHNSLTAYPVRKWWMKPFNFMVKCQDKGLVDQFFEGVNYFDLRFRYIDGELWAAHGLVTYEITAKEAIERLSKLSPMSTQKIYFRAILEDSLGGTQITSSSFRLMINKAMIGTSENLTLHRVGLKSDWGGHVVYNEVDFFGKNDFNSFEIWEKREEMELFEHGLYFEKKKEPCVYECYTYKTIFPRLSSWLLGECPDNSMRNFV